MKKILLFLIFACFNSLYSQDFSTKIDLSLDNNELVLDFMVVRHSSTPFAFRSSNFSVFLNNNALNLPAKYIDHAFDGPWDDASNATNYFDMSLGGGIDYITFNINSIFGSPGTGTDVPTVWTRIGRVRIPILDPLLCTNYTWRLTPMSVRDWNGTNLKPLGDWINSSTCFDLCAPPTASVLTTSQTTICPQNFVTLTSNQNGYHEWTFNSNTLTDTSNSLTTNIPGKYKIRTKVNGCFSTYSNEIVLIQSLDTLLQISASDTTICNGTNNQLTANPNFTNFNWTFGGNVISNSNICTYSQAGKYFVSALNSDNCQLNDSIEIFSNPSATASIAVEDTICPNQQLKLFGNSIVGLGKWIISDQSGNQLFMMDSVMYNVSVADTGSYIFVQFISVSDCDSIVISDSVFVRNEQINPLVQLDDSVCFNSNLTLEVNNSFSGYWTIIQGNGSIQDSSLSITNYNIQPTDSLLIFSWIENGICSSSVVYDTVFVIKEHNFADAILLADTTCDSLINIQALNTSETGQWIIISGTGVIMNPNQFSTYYQVGISDTNHTIVLQWTQSSDCESVVLTDSIFYQINGVQPNIQQVGNQLFVSNYSLGQWFYNGVLLQDSVSNIITPSQSGIYQFGTMSVCDSVYSDTISFIFTGLPLSVKSNIIIYPNPSADEIYIKGIDGNFELMLTDLNGKVLIVKELNQNLSLKRSELGLSSGSYILKLKTATEEFSKLIIWY